MNLDEMTIDQMKALAYDLIVGIEQAQSNLRVVNSEIQKRQAMLQAQPQAQQPLSLVK